MIVGFTSTVGRRGTIGIVMLIIWLYVTVGSSSM